VLFDRHLRDDAVLRAPADWRDLQQMEHVLGKYVISITVDHW
jgi:hypothetical protein